jgi:hypothetical protein
METAQVTMIKKDAVIDIKVGAGFMGRLQQTFNFITKPLTKEDVEKYTEELKNITSENTEFSEPWMTALSCVTLLLKNLEEEAKKQGHTYVKEISEDASKPSQLDDLFTEE